MSKNLPMGQKPANVIGIVSQIFSPESRVLIQTLNQVYIERPDVSNAEITTLCTTVPLLLHLRALVITGKCACLITAFLCWLFLSSYRRDFNLYRELFPSPEPIVRPKVEPKTTPAQKDQAPPLGKVPTAWDVACDALKKLVKNGCDSRIDSEVIMEKLAGFPEESLNDNKQIDQLLFDLLPPDFNTYSDNQRKTVFNKICQIAYEIVCKNHEDSVHSFFNVRVATDYCREVREQGELVHQINVELADLLKSVFEKLTSPNQRNNFLSTTITLDLSANHDACPMENLTIATFLMLINPTYFRVNIFPQIKAETGDCEWFCIAFLRFLTLKPSNAHRKVNLNKMMRGEAGAIGEKIYKTSTNVPINKLANEIFTWLESKSATYVKNNFKNLPERMVIDDLSGAFIDDVCSFSVSDFKKLSSLFHGDMNFKIFIFDHVKFSKAMPISMHMTMDRSEMCLRYILNPTSAALGQTTRSPYMNVHFTSTTQEGRIVFVSDHFLRNYLKFFRKWDTLNNSTIAPPGA
jgi:hypothetical protein